MAVPRISIGSQQSVMFEWEAETNRNKSGQWIETGSGETGTVGVLKKPITLNSPTVPVDSRERGNPLGFFNSPTVTDINVNQLMEITPFYKVFTSIFVPLIPRFFGRIGRNAWLRLRGLCRVRIFG